MPRKLQLLSPLIGPQGPQGETGETGATGPRGPAGIHVGPEAPEDPTVGLWLDTDEDFSADVIPVPETSTVGQTIVVKSVDENGKPTEWEAVDMSSGGEKWELIADVTLEEQVTSFSIDQDTNGQPFRLRKYMLAYVWNTVTDGSTIPGFCFLSENGGGNTALYTSGFTMPKADKIVGGIVANELLPNNTCCAYAMYDNIQAKLDPFSPLNHQYVYNRRNELKQDSGYIEFSQVGAGSGLFPAGSRIMLWGIRA